MKKLILILTVILALFAGNLMAQGADEGQRHTLQYAQADGDEGGEVVDPPAVDEAVGSDEDELDSEGTEEPAATWDSDGDSGDTSWMLTSTVLVLFMTIPGLSLFYGGLVRKKNVLSILAQCFAITCMVTILWCLYGYSVAFNTEGMIEGTVNFNSFFGGLDWWAHGGIPAMTGSIPTTVHSTFQLTFAIITPALMVGAFAERMKFKAVLIFVALWLTMAYLPIAHMVWSGDGGLMWDWGVLDFAGGTVVHINAGIAALVACILLKERKGHGTENMPPHNVPFVVIGASILWVGWFGFNAGSAVTAGEGAGMAMLVTQVATGTAAFTWMVVEWRCKGKPTAVGMATGAVAGLVAITPASGFSGPIGALIIGVAAGAICFWACACLKKKFGYDDSLDVFGVHAIGGIVGAILTGVVVAPSLGGVSTPDEYTMGGQLLTQFKGVIVTIIWTGVAAAFAFKVAAALCGGCRVSEDNETEGLDVTDHGEGGYSL